MLTYEEAFFLRENPFCPATPLEGLSSPRLMSNLASQPLRVHEDDKLMCLYCDDVGGASLSRFKETVFDGGYDPPKVGSESFLTLVLGPQGTGKTTLANVMVHHLKQCKPKPPGEWKVFDDWAELEFDQSEAQVAAMAELRAKVVRQTTDKDYCCVLLDNMKSGAELAAFNLYGELFQCRIVFVFLLSSDPLLLKKTWDNVKYDPVKFQTSALEPHVAVGYIRHRVSTYRTKETQVPTAPDIYPFDSQDIRRSIAAKSLGRFGEVQGIVTLRQLNTTLCRALRDALRGPSPLALPISLAQSYQKMVA